MHIFTGDFNFKGLTVRHLYKLFGIKGLMYEMWMCCASVSVVLCSWRVITFSATLSSWAQDHPYGLTEDTNNRIYWSQCTDVAVYSCWLFSTCLWALLWYSWFLCIVEYLIKQVLKVNSSMTIFSFCYYLTQCFSCVYFIEMFLNRVTVKNSHPRK
jgi:hypothetical protein